MSYLLVVVILLGHPNWRTREAAHSYLVKLDYAAIPALLAGEKNSDLETKTRCKIILDGWYRKYANEILEAYKPDNGKWPWIAWQEEDGRWLYFNSSVRDSCNNYFEQASATTPDSPPDYPLWREACRLWLLDLIRQRVDIDKIVKALCDRERLYRERGN
jgi:hypothetical protein